MTDGPEGQQPEPEQARSHEMDLLDMVAAKNDRHRQTVERLHGFEVPDHQKEKDDE
jgi:hypothetical protein